MYLHDRDLENYWALDIETDDLDASKIWVCCVENVITREKRTFYDEATFKDWHSKEHKYVTHNGVSFDIPVINRLWNARIGLSRVVDTLVLSYLYNPKLPVPPEYISKVRSLGRKAKGPHSLEVWGFRLKNFKIEFEDWSQLTPEMVEYCQQDVSLTVNLYLSLSSKMIDLGYSEKSAEIEHYFRYIIDKQHLNGFKFNRLKANMLYLTLRQMQYETEAYIRSFFKPKLVVAGIYEYRLKKDGTETASFLRHKENFPKLQFNKDRTKYRTFKYQHFNVGSPAQRIERLLEVGWKPTENTPKGNPKVDEESVIAFAEKSGNPYVGEIANWLVYSGRANMIRTWLNNLDRKDDCIRGKVMSCGAGTRRCTHSAPNSANVPSVEARFGRSSRSLWTARPDRVLVGADASGLEGRVFIHYLGSEEAEQFMLNDPHTANAEAISKAVGFEVARSPTKNLFYARLYGASDYKLGTMLGGKAPLGEVVRQAIDRNIPGFEELVAKVGREYDDNDGRLETVDGGFVKCPSPHSALNYKFQSCGAIIMKVGAISLIKSVRKERLDMLKVGDIHDEWQLDCHPDHAQRVGELACESMTIAGEELNMSIKIEGEYSIGKNWAETH